MSSQEAHLEPYRHAATRHGNGFEVTLWANPDSQRLRFEVMAELYPLGGKRVLDAGCSRGDFAAYLIEQGTAFAHYIGIDGLCDVIDYAKSRDLSNCEFHCGDFIHEPALLSKGRPHIICISGSLNTLHDDQVQTVLEAAWMATEEALMFNFLSDRAKLPDKPESIKPARRFDTLSLLDWALGKTGQVVFRQDYFKSGHDATILLRKESMDRNGRA